MRKYDCSSSSRCMKVIYKSKASVLIPSFHREESSQLRVHYPRCLATMQMLFFLILCQSSDVSQAEEARQCQVGMVCQAGEGRVRSTLSGSPGKLIKCKVQCWWCCRWWWGGWFCKTNVMLWSPSAETGVMVGEKLNQKVWDQECRNSKEQGNDSEEKDSFWPFIALRLVELWHKSGSSLRSTISHFNHK